MAASRKRAKLGDVLEVSTPRGLAYVQYAGKHPSYGAAIRVLPGFFQERPKDWSALLAQEGYFVFYPVGIAVSQGIVEVAARLAIPPGRELPTVYRRSGYITPEGKITAWLICDGEKETLRRELSPEERKLFIAAMWNHAFLVGRIVDEWHPEEQVDSIIPKKPPTIIPPLDPPRDEVPGSLQHYLYFKKKDAADTVAAELKQRGFDVERRRSADGKNWLVLATHTLADEEELPGVRDSLEQLAQRHAGEYDGWELATAR